MILSITADGQRHFLEQGFTAASAGGRGTLFVLDWPFSQAAGVYYEEHKVVVDGHAYTFVGYFSYDASMKMVDSVDVFNDRYEKVASIVDVFVPVGAKPVDIENDQFYMSGVAERVVDGGGDDYADLGGGDDLFVYRSGCDKIYGGEGLDRVEAAGFFLPSLSVTPAGDDWFDIRSGGTLLFSTKYVELVAFGGLAAWLDHGSIRWEAAPELVTSIAQAATIETAKIFMGAAPSQERFNDLVAFAELQYRAYAGWGVTNPSLGPFEAFGKAYATDSVSKAAFASTYGGLGDGAFLEKGYAAVFGALPSAGAKAALAAQLDYFEGLYRGAGVAAPEAELQARGAVLGQMIGYAFTDPPATASATPAQTALGVALVGQGADIVLPLAG